MATAVSPNTAVQQAYERLEARVEKSLHTPASRLKLAEEMYAFSCREEGSEALRIKALQQAVRLDPFRGSYRLELARVEKEVGLLDEAIAEYQRGLEYWPDAPLFNLLMAEAQIDKGQLAKAAEYLDKVNGNAPVMRRAVYARIECALREAREPEDWKKAANLLAEVEISKDEVGLYCEKCLKLVLDCEDETLSAQVLKTAEEKIGSKFANQPAYGLLKRVAALDCNGTGLPKEKPTAGKALSPLEGFLTSYRLARKYPVLLPDDAERVKRVGEWQAFVRRQQRHWPGLQDVYIAGLDEWAAKAYQKKEFGVANALWSEVERLSADNPAVLHNLALIYTRLGDEKGYEWYWDRTADIWETYSEVMPDADGYRKQLLQKHQAFVEGAQNKLQSISNWQDLLDLGLLWTKEAIAFLTIQQLAFRNPYFRCGVMRDDFMGEEQRLKAIEAGSDSMQKWLDLLAQWSGLDDSWNVVNWRSERLSAALDAAMNNPGQRFRYYDEEKEKFELHREYMVSQYIALVFRVMMTVAGEMKLDEESMRQKYARLAGWLMTFPHSLLKAGVRKVVTNLEEDTDLEQLVLNYAIGPWFKRSQELLEANQPGRAAIYLKEMIEIAPDFVPGYLYLAQCYAAEEKFEDAYRLLETARQHVKPGDEMNEQIDHFAEQMDFARVNKRLAAAHAHMEQGRGEKAVQECQKALKEFPEHPYVLFVMAQASLMDLEINDARKALVRAKAACKHEDELKKAIVDMLDQVTEHGADIILSKAVPKMQAGEWQAAADLLQKGRKLDRPDARVIYYEAMCRGRAGDITTAKALANEALSASKKAGDHELQREIEDFIPQIPYMIIGEDLARATKAMEKQRWSQALDSLNSALGKMPTSAVAKFYQAVCFFRMERWDEADKAARTALAFCKDKEDDSIREQLNTLLEQLKYSMVAGDMKTAQKAIERQKWADAQIAIDRVLRVQPKLTVAVFYKALILFRMNQIDESSRYIQIGLDLCQSPQDDSIREQLQQLTAATNQAREAAKTNAIVEDINRGNFYSAMLKAQVLQVSDPYNATFIFFEAVAKFRDTMDDLNKQRITPSQQPFDKVLEILDKAYLYSNDNSLNSQIQALRTNVNQVKDQLYKMGVYS